MPNQSSLLDALGVSGCGAPVREISAPLEGWRVWRLALDHDQTPRLVALSRPKNWDGPIATSDVLPEMGERAGYAGRAGLHAWRTPGGLASSLSFSAAMVYGQVTLYGQVCVHEAGYRAEHARIDRLFVRACGLHRAPPLPAFRGGDIFMLLAHFAEHSRFAGAYCGCGALGAADWLPDVALDELAGALESRYQCDVTIDPQRARTSRHSCTAHRLLAPSNSEHR